MNGLTEVDVLVAGLGPGGCAAALAARAAGLSTLAVEARGPLPTRARLVLVREGARAGLRRLGLPDLTEGRRTTTIKQLETRLRAALEAPPGGPATAPFAWHWHTEVAGLEVGPERVRVTLRDADGGERQVWARHVIDATGGRLEHLGRPPRERQGRSHWVVTAEYATPPWFDGIAGVRDPATHEACLLFPTWGRKGVIVYFDTQPGRAAEPEALVQRFEAVTARLGLGAPADPVVAVDVFLRGLRRPGQDRVLAIGDGVGTVDVLLAAGVSAAIEDALEAVQFIGQAQRAPDVATALALTQEAARRLYARHRANRWRSRALLLGRPLFERLWPACALEKVERDTPRPPPLLWPAVRFVLGRRPKAA